MTLLHRYSLWGLLDLLFINRFIFHNISYGFIPFYGDIISFRYTYSMSPPGLMTIISFILSLALIASVAVSAWLLLSGSRYAWCLVLIQTPFRLFTDLPSLWFLPWLLQLTTGDIMIVNLTLLLASETLKIISLLRKWHAVLPASWCRNGSGG